MSTGTARGKATGTTAGGGPATLQQAHDVLRRQRPPVGASAAKWRAFHEKADRIYTSVAELDSDHHFEALAFAGMAREDAEKVCNAADGAEKPWRSA